MYESGLRLCCRDKTSRHCDLLTICMEIKVVWTRFVVLSVLDYNFCLEKMSQTSGKKKPVKSVFFLNILHVVCRSQHDTTDILCASTATTLTPCRTLWLSTPEKIGYSQGPPDLWNKKKQHKTAGFGQTAALLTYTDSLFPHSHSVQCQFTTDSISPTALVRICLRH